MKIDANFKTLTPAPAGNTPKAANISARSSDAVSLSQAAGALQGNTKPPVDATRIQEIKDAITQGRFTINPEAIAEGLIETARDLVNSQRKA